MANGYPAFGGTNGVPLLDIGQRGGTRETADPKTAFFSGNVIQGPDQVASVEHPLPQQDVVIRDNLGFEGSQIVWEGVIRADSAATMATITAELNELKHGSLRAGGILGPPDPSRFKETRLTDFEGQVLSEKAVLADWRQRGRRMKSPEWAVIMNVILRFRALN